MKYRWLGHLVALLLAGGVTLLLLLASSLVRAQEPGWSKPVSLSRSFAASYLPDIAADQAGNLYVVWDAQFEERDGGWGDGVGFAMWDGTSWSSAIDITALEVYHLPSIAVDSRGRLHLTGVGYVGLGYMRAWAQERPVNARAWSDPIDISNSYPRVYWNDILIDSRDRIHVVFSDQAPNQDRKVMDGQCVGEDCSWAFYTRSTDGGDNWSTPLKISPSMASGARVMITGDDQNNLYVVWSTESTQVTVDRTFAPSTNGFTYSLDGGGTWHEPETQILDTGGDPPGNYWLSVAVDSQQTVHVVGVGSGIQHLYKEGLDSPWIEDTVPPLNADGLSAGYGFREIIVDSNDNLHFVLPTYQPPGLKSLPGLFHAIWSRESGWSSWARATMNARGKGCGLGNLVMSGGNQLNVVWFEHLEGSSGHLFGVPRGRIEIYYATLETRARFIPPTSLPPMPTPTVVVSTAQPIPTTQVMVSVTPRVTASLPTMFEGDSRLSTPTPMNELVVGIGATALFLAITVGVIVSRRRT